MKKMISLIMAFMLIITQIMLAEPTKAYAAEAYTLSGVAHVQTYGDRAGTYKNGTLTLGTTGQGKRLESITINFTNNTGYSGGMEYRVHRQTYGWTDWTESGKPAGTTGQGKRLEGIQIRLTGELAKHYSVTYRVHAQTYGWNQGWQYDGALAGTEGEAKRLESLEVRLVPRNEAMGVTYRVHRQTYGWEKTWAKNGTVAGTTGQSKRLEGITIALTGNEYEGGITYRTHVQSYGWLEYEENGAMSGTSGKAKRLEAIQIQLTGEVEKYYDVYYRVHAQSYGWLNWAKNGEISGTSGMGKRLEAIQIVLVKKNTGAPGNVGGIASVTGTPYVDGKTAQTTQADREWIPEASEWVNVWIVLEPAYDEVKYTYGGTKYYHPYNDPTNPLEQEIRDGEEPISKSEPIHHEEKGFSTMREVVRPGYWRYKDTDGKTWHDPVYEKKWVVDEQAETKYGALTEDRDCEQCYGCNALMYGQEEVDSHRCPDDTIHGRYTHPYQVVMADYTYYYPEVGHWEYVLVKDGYWEVTK